MTISANSDDTGARVECSASAFFRGLFRLVTTFFFANAARLAVFAAIVLGIVPLCWTMSINGFAWLAVGTFSAGVGCLFLAFFVRAYESSLSAAGGTMLVAHMWFSLTTVMRVDAGISSDQTWWQVSSVLVRAAILPTYVFAKALHLVTAIGVIALVGWGMLKLVRAARSAARYICEVGQEK